MNFSAKCLIGLVAIAAFSFSSALHADTTIAGWTFETSAGDRWTVCAEIGTGSRLMALTPAARRLFQSSW